MASNIFFNRITERGWLPEDSEGLRIKKSTLTIVTFPLGIAGILWAAIYFAQGCSIPGCVPFLYGMLSFVNLGIYMIAKNFSFFRFTQILLTLLLPFFLQISLGGFSASSSVILWSIIAPIGASVFYNIRISFYWFLGFLLLLSAAFFVDEFATVEFNYHLTDEFIRSMFMMNIVGVTGISFTIQYYFLNKQGLIKRIVKTKNQEISDSIAYASNIQTAILPSEKLMNQLVPNHFIIYKPKDIVSGDFYWIEKRKHKTYIAVVDCTGHGVPGAFVSVIGHSCLNRVINEFDKTKPAEILNKLSDLVEETFSKSEGDINDGMDIALCCIDSENNTIEYAGANNPLYYIQNGELKEIKSDRQAIGGDQNKKPYTNNTLNLEKIDCFFLLTDGFADQFGGPNQKKFKTRALRELLLKVHNKTIHEMKRSILKRHEDWRGDLEQIDDICIFGWKKEP